MADTRQVIRNCAHFTRRDGMEGLEVMHARWIEHSFSPHMHDFYAISLNYQGAGAFECAGNTYEALPGTCNLVSAGQVHTGRTRPDLGWTYRNLYVERRLMASLLEAVDSPHAPDVVFRSPSVQDPVLAERLLALFDSLSERNCLLQDESLLLSVFARLNTSHVNYPLSERDLRGERRPVLRVKEWLDEHYAQAVSIHALANIARLSPYYLIRAFQKELGLPPHQYQMMVRINHARKLLHKGSDIARVACDTGFYDQSHLTRCFSRTLGITPARYARRRG